MNGDIIHSPPIIKIEKFSADRGSGCVPSRRLCPGLPAMAAVQGERHAASPPATSQDSWPELRRPEPTIVRTVCVFEPVGVLGPTSISSCRPGWDSAGDEGSGCSSGSLWAPSSRTHRAREGGMVPGPGCWHVTQGSTSLFRWARQQAPSSAPPPFRPRGAG